MTLVKIVDSTLTYKGIRVHDQVMDKAFNGEKEIVLTYVIKYIEIRSRALN